jgi:hypothetical protein
MNIMMRMKTAVIYILLEEVIDDDDDDGGGVPMVDIYQFSPPPSKVENRMGDSTFTDTQEPKQSVD